MKQKSRAKKGKGGGAFFVIYTFLCAPFTVTNTWGKKRITLKWSTILLSTNATCFRAMWNISEEKATKVQAQIDKTSKDKVWRQYQKIVMTCVQSGVFVWCGPSCGGSSPQGSTYVHTHTLLCSTCTHHTLVKQGGRGGWGDEKDKRKP